MAAEYTYRVSAWWTSGRTGLAKCESSPNTIHFSEAAELGGLQGRWTPEQLLLCALAGCFTTTFHEVARSRQVRVHRSGSGDRRQRPPQPEYGMQFQRNPDPSQTDGAFRRAVRSRAGPAAPDQSRVHDFARHHRPADSGALRSKPAKCRSRAGAIRTRP